MPMTILDLRSPSDCSSRHRPDDKKSAKTTTTTTTTTAETLGVERNVPYYKLWDYWSNKTNMKPHDGP